MRVELRMCVAQLWLIAISASLLAVDASRTLDARDGQWQEAHKVRARLLSGEADPNNAATRYAFVQLELEPDWKTYWRNPGEGGGIPPEFSWTGSKNLADAQVFYPAPKRLKDSIGDTIGYKERVIFPVQITAREPHEPIALALNFRFGICKDICVPTELTLTGTVPVAAKSSQIDVAKVLQTVPRQGASLKPNDPSFVSAEKPRRSGEHWLVMLRTKHAAGAKDTDLFLEAPDGVFIPTPKRASGDGQDGDHFQITITDSEYKDLKGRSIQATVVDNLGASQTQFLLQ